MQGPTLCRPGYLWSTDKTFGSGGFPKCRVHQLKAAGVTQPLFDETARQALYQATRGILRKVNKLAVSALRLAAERKASTVDEALLLDAVGEVLL